MTLHTSWFFRCLNSFETQSPSNEGQSVIYSGRSIIRSSNPEAAAAEEEDEEDQEEEEEEEEPVAGPSHEVEVA